MNKARPGGDKQSLPPGRAFCVRKNATEIKIWSQDIMTIKNSEGEIFGFFRENIKEIYGYK